MRCCLTIYVLFAADMYISGFSGDTCLRAVLLGKEFAMDNNKCKNESIKCSVSQCKHNMVTEDYCCLDCISVGTHEDDPEVPECTDCNSFCKRTGC